MDFASHSPKPARNWPWRSRARASDDRFEDVPLAPLYDDDGPGDPEFGAWLDERLGLKGEPPAPGAPKRRTRGWWIRRGLLAFLALFVLVLVWLALTAPLSKSLKP